VGRADLDDLYRALDASRTTSPVRSAEKTLAPQVLAAVKRELGHPSTARTLTWICTTLAAEQATSPLFAESADLIVARFANSPDIGNLCELWGASPTGSDKVERDLRTILDKNQDRAVCAAAAFALASVVQRAGESRQNEAAALFEAFVKKFDGKEQYQDIFVAEKSRETLSTAYWNAMNKMVASTIQLTLMKKGGVTIDTTMILVPIFFSGHLFSVHFVTSS
jgi:hypothetical protein